jgi:hypothetical protein
VLLWRLDDYASVSRSYDDWAFWKRVRERMTDEEKLALPGWGPCMLDGHPCSRGGQNPDNCSCTNHGSY